MASSGKHAPASVDVSSYDHTLNLPRPPPVLQRESKINGCKFSLEAERAYIGNCS